MALSKTTKIVLIVGGIVLIAGVGAYIYMNRPKPKKEDNSDEDNSELINIPSLSFIDKVEILKKYIFLKTQNLNKKLYRVYFIN